MATIDYDLDNNTSVGNPQGSRIDFDFLNNPLGIAPYSYQDEPGTRGLRQGTMPTQMLIEKNGYNRQSVSQIQGREDVNDYQREILKDLSCDEPWLASDELRKGYDPDGGNHSWSHINMRLCGSRSTAEPYMPDGTFTDWEFMERDPRGIATGPDMRKIRDQAWKRAKNIKFRPDGADDEASGVPSPAEMVKKIKGGFYLMKKRMNIFDESMDNMTRSAMPNRPYQKTPHLTVGEGQYLDMADSITMTDSVAKLSNNYDRISNYTTTDHRFKISKYTAVREGYKPNPQSALDARGKVGQSTHQENSRDTLNRRLAAQISKSNMGNIASNTILGNNIEVKNKQVNKIDNNVIKQVLAKSQVQSSTQSSNVDLNTTGQGVNNVSRLDMSYLPRSVGTQIDSSEFNSIISRTIENGYSRSEKLNPVQANEVRLENRNKIEQSMAEDGLFVQVSNKKSGLVKGASSISSKIDWVDNSKSENTPTAHMEVKSYRGVKPASAGDKSSQRINGIVYEGFGGDSSTQSVLHRQQQQLHQDRTKNGHLTQQEFIEHNLRDPAKKITPGYSSRQAGNMRHTSEVDQEDTIYNM